MEDAMADNTIDSLNLEISADTSKAEKALGKLATTIANLATSLNGGKCHKVLESVSRNTANDICHERILSYHKNG